VEVTWKYYMSGGEETNNNLKKGTKYGKELKRKYSINCTPELDSF